MTTAKSLWQGIRLATGSQAQNQSALNPTCRLRVAHVYRRRCSHVAKEIPGQKHAAALAHWLTVMSCWSSSVDESTLRRFAALLVDCVGLVMRELHSSCCPHTHRKWAKQGARHEAT